MQTKTELISLVSRMETKNLFKPLNPHDNGVDRKVAEFQLAGRLDKWQSHLLANNHAITAAQISLIQLRQYGTGAGVAVPTANLACAGCGWAEGSLSPIAKHSFLRRIGAGCFAMKKSQYSLIPPDIRLLKASEVAQLLRVSIRTVWRLVSAGKLPKPVYVGRLARWSVANLKDFLDQE